MWVIQNHILRKKMNLIPNHFSMITLWSKNIQNIFVKMIRNHFWFRIILQKIFWIFFDSESFWKKIFWIFFFRLNYRELVIFMHEGNSLKFYTFVLMIEVVVKLLVSLKDIELDRPKYIHLIHTFLILNHFGKKYSEYFFFD